MISSVSHFFPSAATLLLDMVEMYWFSLLCSISALEHITIDLPILLLMDILLISSLGCYE